MAVERAPLAPNPVICSCFGHCGIGIGAEAYRWILIDVGADPRTPALRGEKEQIQVLRRYGGTVLRFGIPFKKGEIPLVPRALLIDLDPRAANLILQSYPDLFAMKDKHALYGMGGAARNWAEGRTRFRNEIETKYDVQRRFEELSPEPVRGFNVTFAMGGGTGGAFASAFMEHIKSTGDGTQVVATFGVIPEFGWDPVILGPASISIVMNLDYQIRYSDMPLLIDNKAARSLAQRFADGLSKRSSIVDELPEELEIGWRDYRNMNLISAHVMSMFVASFTRETEWDMSNYRTWLASSKPRFVFPWLIPIVPKESEINGILSSFSEARDGVLFDFESEEPSRMVGEKASCCVLVKARGRFDQEHRERLRRVIKERFPMEDKRIIFIRIPCLGKEPGGALALLNNKAIGGKILSIVKEAEEAWDGYKNEYERWGLKQEEFKQSLINVVNHFS